MATGNTVKSGSTQKRRYVLVRYKKPTKHNLKYPTAQLPFFSNACGSWDMPKTSGYGTGCDMGKAAGVAYMKALRDKNHAFFGGTLQHIIFDMLSSGVDPNDDKQRGQIVGFFAYLDSWLTETAKLFGSNLDTISKEQIEEDMTRAANETEKEHDARTEALIREYKNKAA